MANSKRDGNNINSGNAVPTWIAYNDTTGFPEPIRVDPIFGAIECFVVAADSNIPTALNRALHDGDNRSSGNAIPTLLGYNETTGLTESLRCGLGGELLIKIVS